MTAIVAFKYEDSVYLCGDRCGSNGYTHILVKRPKVFKVTEDLYFGYTTSFYMGQILEHCFSVPPRMSHITDDNYLYTVVVPELTKIFRDKCFGSKQDEKTKEPSFGEFILVYKNRIFIFQNNSSLLEVEHAGVGCGGDMVLASILTTLDIIDTYYDHKLNVKYIVESAYKHCSNIMCGVSKEHDIIKLGAE